MMGEMGNMQGMQGGMQQGMQYGAQGMQNMPGMTDPNAVAGAKNGLLGVGSGLDFNNLLGGILNLTVDILVILLFVGLIVGAVVLVKRYLFDGTLLATSSKAACSKCGQTLRSDWNTCPKCGEPKAAAVNAAPQTA